MIINDSDNDSDDDDRIVRRIRDQMDDKEVQKRVKMVDTASFSVFPLSKKCFNANLLLFFSLES